MAHITTQKNQRDTIVSPSQIYQKCTDWMDKLPLSLQYPCKSKELLHCGMIRTKSVAQQSSSISYLTPCMSFPKEVEQPDALITGENSPAQFLKNRNQHRLRPWTPHDMKMRRQHFEMNLHLAVRILLCADLWENDQTESFETIQSILVLH